MLLCDMPDVKIYSKRDNCVAKKISRLLLTRTLPQYCP